MVAQNSVAPAQRAFVADKLSGFDLVFSPQKSLSLATEFAATPAEFAAFWNAVDRANDRAMRYGAQEVGWARKGAGGEDGTDPGAVGWMTFWHSTARVSGLFVPEPPSQFGKSVQSSVQRLRSRPEQAACRRNWLGNAAPFKVASISPGRFCANLGRSGGWVDSQRADMSISAGIDRDGWCAGSLSASDINKAAEAFSLPAPWPLRLSRT